MAKTPRDERSPLEREADTRLTLERYLSSDDRFQLVHDDYNGQADEAEVQLAWEQ